jgi:hypothetical protein
MKILTIIFFAFSLSHNSLSQVYFYSFENTFSGWDTTGIDLQIDDSTLVWSLHPDSELSIDSSYSIRYYLDNGSDAGKIWIQKPFDVEQNTDYIVSIDYKFATSDFEGINLWTIITGVHLSPPTSHQELMFQGHTSNGYDFDIGYIWLDKNYEFIINSDTSSKLWIAIGIWGNWEGPKTYYLDSLSIRIQENNPNSLPNDREVLNKYYLHQNYPNPFNPITKIGFEVPKEGNVSLKIYNLAGREVATLIDKYVSAGAYEVEFNAEGLSSGIYYYRLKSNDFNQIKKMILIK